MICDILLKIDIQTCKKSQYQNKYMFLAFSNVPFNILVNLPHFLHIYMVMLKLMVLHQKRSYKRCYGNFVTSNTLFKVRKHYWCKIPSFKFCHWGWQNCRMLQIRIGVGVGMGMGMGIVGGIGGGKWEGREGCSVHHYGMNHIHFAGCEQRWVLEG